MIDVEIVVAGALGDLVLSTLPSFTAERRLFTRLVVGGQAAAGTVLEQLEMVGLEVITVKAIPPSGSGDVGRPHG